MRTVRSFIAIDLPDQVRSVLTNTQSKLASLPGGHAFRWTTPDAMHLTIKFLGEISQERIPIISSLIDDCCASSFALRLSLTHLGAFPNTRKPRIIWAGIHDAQDNLDKLASCIEQQTAKSGFPRERRAFRPHLTLGRAKKTASSVALPDGFSDVILPDTTWRTMYVTLYKSTLTPSGPIYTALSKSHLRNAGDT